MSSAIRAAQLADQIRDYVAEWIARDLPGYLLTVTQVTLSPDLQKGTVWVASFKLEHLQSGLRTLKGLEKTYSRALYQKLRRHSAPHISFVADKSIEEAERIEQLLK